MNYKINKPLSLNLNFVFAFLFLISLLSLTIFAGGNKKFDPVSFSSWETVGPSGGDVRVITIDPKDKNRLYVSTLDGQIHTSSDGGLTWRLLVNFNSPLLVLDQLMVDSQDSQILYTSGHRHKQAGGFYKSTDGGETWKQSKDLENASIHSMTQSLKNPNILMVGTINGVWVSNDKGDNWKKISSGTMPINIDSMAIDPRDDNTIFAGTWWRAYKSTDSGKSWRLIKNGMIDDSDVFAITINPRDPDHIIASACSGIYESNNNGEKWTKINGIPSQSRRTRDIVQHPTVPGTIYAGTTEGFWMSTNGGKSWKMTTQRDLEINSIAVHPELPNRVFLGTNNYGVLVSYDGGQSFKPTNDNFTSRLTYTVTADIQKPNRFYATTQNTATGGGFVFLSDDGGKTWNQAKSLDVNRVSPYSMIQDRVSPNILYMGSNVGMFRSMDYGETWSQLTAPKPPRTSRSRSRRRAKATPTPEPETPGLIKALEEKVKVLSYTEDGSNGIFAGTDNGLYRSYDVLKGWEKVEFGEGINDNVFVIHASPNQPGTIWVGTATSGVIVSHDNGASWKKIGGNNAPPQYAPISSITVDPQNPDNIYVGTSQTFYLSRDGGKSWTRRGGNLPLGNYTSILINPNNSDEIFISSALQADGGVFYSSDAGWNWDRIDSRDLKLPSHRVWSMQFDPNDPNRIIAGSHSSGVYIIERKQIAKEEKTQTEEKPKDAITRPRITKGT